MTESLWPRRLNENHWSCCRKSIDFLQQFFYFFIHFLLQFFLAPSIMRLY
jgi:hypothetical protein